MDLYAVATQVGAALGGVTPTLRVYPYGAKSIEAPAGLFVPPGTISYHEGAGLGAERLTDAMVMVLVYDLERREAYKQLAGYLAASGTGSVKAVLEAYAWTACHVVTVTSADIDTMTYNGAEYLAAFFHLDIFGNGS